LQEKWGCPDIRFHYFINWREILITLFEGVVEEQTLIDEDHAQ